MEIGPDVLISSRVAVVGRDHRFEDPTLTVYWSGRRSGVLSRPLRGTTSSGSARSLWGPAELEEVASSVPAPLSHKTYRRSRSALVYLPRRSVHDSLGSAGMTAATSVLTSVPFPRPHASIGATYPRVAAIPPALSICGTMEDVGHEERVARSTTRRIPAKRTTGRFRVGAAESLGPNRSALSGLSLASGPL